MTIESKDLQIDVFRNGTNKTTMRITHLPTGIWVENETERSLHKMQEKLLELLEAKIKKEISDER